MLNFEVLSEFLAFAEYGTLSEAAERLHTSQPSLSRNMRRLEDELQVDLFEHGKNRLTLNDTGRLAVEYARKIMDDADLMESAVKMYDRQKNTVSIGSVAPAPLWKLPGACSRVFPQKSVNMEIQDETTLMQGLLATRTYQLIILPYPLEDDRCGNMYYESENLMFCVKKDHPLAKQKSAHFSDMDGETFLVLNEIGFWDKLHRKNLPHSRFIMQSTTRDIADLASQSNFGTFVTDLSLKDHGLYSKDRVVIPIEDDDAHADFYITYLKEDEARLRPLLKALNQ